mmetsp:Transcript_3785/g.8460  ORF Transcript_3785/g.8460 Transcript_3785/m.8460 type:complete len:123 (+) Transcript_3785:835-1203(+)
MVVMCLFHRMSTEYLDISRNRLEGELPSSIGSLTNLVTIDVSHNDLTSTIPNDIGNLTKLEVLNLGSNSFTGSLPSELVELSNMGKAGNGCVFVCVDERHLIDIVVLCLCRTYHQSGLFRIF